MMQPEIERIRGEQLRKTPVAQQLACSGVQFPGHRVQLFLSEATHVASLGQVLSQQAVGVLVDAALPGTVQIGEVDRHPGGFRQPLMRRHSPVLIVRQRQTCVRLDTIEHMAEADQRRVGTGIAHPGQHREQVGSLDQCTDRGTMVRPLDEITLPVPRYQPFLTIDGRS